MASIRARQTRTGQTRYRAEVRLAGFDHCSKTFTTQREAKTWATQTESALLAKRDNNTGQPVRTVGDVIDRYQVEVMPLKPKAHNQAQQLNWFKDEIGSLYLRELSVADLKNCQTQLLNEPIDHARAQQRSPATVNRYMAALSHALTVASDEWEWLDESPFLRLRRLPESRGRTRVLSTDQTVDGELIEGELTRLLKACEASTQSALYPMVMLALSTGMRIGEISALRWRDIDFDQQRITITTSKNGDARSVPLVGKAYSLLREWAATTRVNLTACVFARKDNVNQSVGIATAWRQALQSAQITDCRFHDLRHSAASYLAMSGATHSELAQILGHRSLAMVTRYAHLSPVHTTDLVHRMNQQWLE